MQVVTDGDISHDLPKTRLSPMVAGRGLNDSGPAGRKERGEDLGPHRQSQRRDWDWNRFMVITDRYDHVIDDKGRLAIPSQIRNAMDAQEDGVGFYLVPESRYLQLIPEKLFKRLAANVTAGLALSPDAAKVRRMVFGSATYLEPDKTGRVIIPERFMADSKKRDPFTHVVLDREVTLVGNNDRLELWNRADLEGHMRELLADRVSLQAAMQQVFSAPPPHSPSQPGTMSGAN